MLFPAPFAKLQSPPEAAAAPSVWYQIPTASASPPVAILGTSPVVVVLALQQQLAVFVELPLFAGYNVLKNKPD